MINTTDYSQLYMIFSVAALCIILSLGIMFWRGINFVSIALMMVAAISSFDISNIYTDGSLMITNQFNNSTEVFVNQSTSQLFQFIGLFLLALSFVQIYFSRNGYSLFPVNQELREENEDFEDE